jgi:hypothetical protein
MRLKFTLLFLLLISITAQAQKLTGIWRGYFSSPTGLYRDGVKEEMYKYEVQILANKDNSVSGVTYSYKTTVFYGKASAQGIYSPKAKSITLKENSLLELKIAGQSEPCLMTCYLDYSKMDKLEVLQGTFMSVNIKDKGDCGAGKVYLEKVLVSDFKKEDFLSMKKTIDTNKLNKSVPTIPNTGAKSDQTATKQMPIPLKSNKPKTADPNAKPNPAAVNPTIPAAKAPASQLPKPNPATVKPTTVPAKETANTIAKTTAPKTKPGAEDNLVSKSTIPSNQAAIVENKIQAPIRLSQVPKDTLPIKPKEVIVNKAAPPPRVLVDRENILMKTIQIDEENILLEFYDGGIIDHDSISVFHNNKQVIKNGGLALTPITVKIKCSKEDAHHEVIMVAENLGEIPPNTALMVITAGKKRFEVYLTSTEQKNAKVVIDYKPKE